MLKNNKVEISPLKRYNIKQGVIIVRVTKNNDNPINEQKIIDTIRLLGIDMIDEAGSGHPGIVLDAAPIIYTVYAHHLRFDVDQPDFYNRDRFIMSAGHGSSLYYATLFMAGFDISIDDLKKFRQINSITPGHPEYGVTPGVDISTGPLGEGLASAVGFEMARKHTNALLDTKEEIIDYKTYVLCGDGDLMEGVSYEAASLAGTLKLNNLIVLYDSNKTSIDGKIDLSFTENVRLRFEALGWNTLEVIDGEDYAMISAAIDQAKTSDKPTLIQINTNIGQFSKLQGSNLSHGKPLDKEDISAIKEKLNIRDVPFTVSNEAMEDFQELISQRNSSLITDFNEKIAKLNEEDQNFLNELMQKEKEVVATNLELPLEKEGELRAISGQILNAYAKESKIIFGGSADLFSSCKNLIEDGGTFSTTNYAGKNIYFGVREHAMGAILNGLALAGYRPYASTFLAFSDYLRPSIRMSAMMRLPVTYIFTHDSISVGEDGPTHQPIEQLNILRSTINLDVYRPCDTNEIAGVYKHIMSKTTTPSAIVLSRNSVPVLENTSINNIKKGGYIVKKEQRKLDGIIISSGEDVHDAIEVSNRLFVKGFDLRVVSMPSLNTFLNQDKDYIDETLPVEKRKIVIEKAPGIFWHKLIFNDKYIISQEEYGASGKKDDVLKKFSFDIDSLEERVENLIK